MQKAGFLRFALNFVILLNLARAGVYCLRSPEPQIDPVTYIPPNHIDNFTSGVYSRRGLGVLNHFKEIFLPDNSQRIGVTEEYSIYSHEKNVVKLEHYLPKDHSDASVYDIFGHLRVSPNEHGRVEFEPRHRLSVGGRYLYQIAYQLDDTILSRDYEGKNHITLDLLPTLKSSYVINALVTVVFPPSAKEITITYDESEGIQIKVDQKPERRGHYYFSKCTVLSLRVKGSHPISQGVNAYISYKENNAAKFASLLDKSALSGIITYIAIWIIDSFSLVV